MSRTSNVPAELLNGPFTLADARRAGVSRSALRSRRWQRLATGLYCARDSSDDQFEVLRGWLRVLPGDTIFAGATAAWPEFMIDLARLERAVNEVFDGPGAEGKPLLDGASLQTISTERWSAARLECVPCLRLLILRYPLNDYFTAIRRGGRPPLPGPQGSYMAVTRRNYRVLRYPLELSQFELLQAMLEGATVAQAIERAAAVSALGDADLAVQIREWFRFWTAEGFFCGLVSK